MYSLRKFVFYELMNSSAEEKLCFVRGIGGNEEERENLIWTWLRRGCTLGIQLG